MTKRRLRERIAYLEQVIDEAGEEVKHMGLSMCESALNHPSKGGEPQYGYWDGFHIYWATKLEVLKTVGGLLHYD